MTWKEKGKRAGTIRWCHVLHHRRCHARRCHAQNATRSTQDLPEGNPPETTAEGQK